MVGYDNFDRFVEDSVQLGRFGNASEVVREGLRLLEQRSLEDQSKLEWLRVAAKVGFDQLDRGEGITLNCEEELDDFLTQIHEEVVAEMAAERERGE